MNVNAEDCSKFTNYADLKNWKGEEVYESIRDRFVTGDWSKAAQRNQLSEANVEDDEDTVHGDFEDLETGAKYESHQKENSGDEAMQKEDDLAIEKRRLKKLALRAKFDAQYPLINVSLYFLKMVSFCFPWSPHYTCWWTTCDQHHFNFCWYLLYA